MSAISPNPANAPDARATLGKWGEDIAARFLIKKGYSILDRHWTSRIGELDIVAKKADDYIFVEVKTRSSNRFGLPEDAVYGHKQDRLRRMVELYLLKHRLHDVPYQIDTIAIEYEPKTKKTTIRHIEHCM